jgi:lipopolysaccharide transport system ATP-binding protein
MSDIAVHVNHIGKRYVIGQQVERYRTLRDTLTDTIKAPMRRVRTGLQRSGAMSASSENTIWALKDISFEVQSGEAVGIIGHNGAGKSTLLKVLSRITEPTQGYADVHGRIGALLEVGSGFHPELTGRENTYLNGAILGMGKAEINRKFDEIVAFSEVEKFIDTPVKHYSSGMQMRLAFAVAAHLEPEILVIDEVLAVGDASFQRKCLGKMEDVAQHGRTVLFVSHNMPAITRLCSRAILLKDGQVIENGSANDVVAAYLHGVSEGSGMRSWSLDAAPGTDELKLVGLSLVNNAGEPASVVGVEDELHLKISYYVAQPGLSFRCTARFFTQGVVAFASLEPTEMERAKAGVYTSIVTIPPNMLAENEYTVGVSIYASRGAKARYVAERDLLVFQATDPMSGNSARGDYAGPLGGIVRPLLPWRMRYEGADSAWQE